MRGLRFSLAAMLGFVACAAIACRALFYPSGFWHAVVQSACMAVLFFAVIAAVVYQRRHARAFWVGFAISGWGLLGLERVRRGDNALTQLRHHLAGIIHPLNSMPEGSTPGLIIFYFSDTAFWLLLLLLAMVGGLMAGWASQREERLASPQGKRETS